MVERTVARDPSTRLAYSTGGRPAARGEPEESEQPGRSAAGIRLRLERRASGRVVTLVTGLLGTQDEVAALARALKSSCGAGGTVKDGALALQGDQREKIEAVLRARALPSKRAGGR